MNSVPVSAAAPMRVPAQSRRPSGSPVTDFAGVLASRCGVRFSTHAQNRLKSRNITVTPALAGKLERAVNSAAAKGSRDALVMLSNQAFIVNIPNRTVVTAMEGERFNQTIVTNIDTAVIAD